MSRVLKPLQNCAIFSSKRQFYAEAGIQRNVNNSIVAHLHVRLQIEAKCKRNHTDLVFQANNSVYANSHTIHAIPVGISRVPVPVITVIIPSCFKGGMTTAAEIELQSIDP